MKPSGAELREIAALVEQGKIRPVIGRAFPLDRAKEALAYVKTGRAKGKVLVTM